MALAKNTMVGYLAAAVRTRLSAVDNKNGQEIVQTTPSEWFPLRLTSFDTLVCGIFAKQKIHDDARHLTIQDNRLFDSQSCYCSNALV